jgi:hypothetical protein
MIRRLWIIVVLLVAGHAASAAEPAPRPNIIIVLADDK